MTTATIQEFELTSHCTCESYDEETDTSTPSEYCYGCWDDEMENFRYIILAPWLDANEWDENTRIRIEGGGMTWRGVSGFLNTTAEKVVEGLTINGDFTLRFKLDGAELTCSRYSHDEYGAYFRFVLADEEEDYYA